MSSGKSGEAVALVERRRANRLFFSRVSGSQEFRCGIPHQATHEKRQGNRFLKLAARFLLMLGSELTVLFTRAITRRLSLPHHPLLSSLSHSPLALLHEQRQQKERMRAFAIDFAPDSLSCMQEKLARNPANRGKGGDGRRESEDEGREKAAKKTREIGCKVIRRPCLVCPCFAGCVSHICSAGGHVQF